MIKSWRLPISGGALSELKNNKTRKVSGVILSIHLMKEFIYCNPKNLNTEGLFLADVLKSQ